MSLNIGIVGLPNVGKSTIFNALTKSSQALTANYPFATIDPNVGIVEVPDERLAKLSEVSNSEKTIPAIIKFVDIAGIVKGASQGEGLGNKFLANIRECDAIAHVIRWFDDPNVTHVHGTVDPKSDREIIESELLLADLQTVEKRLYKARSDAKSNQKDKLEYLRIVEKLNDGLMSGKRAISIDFDENELEALKDLHLLTFKPTLFIVNISEEKLKTFDPIKASEIIGVENPELIVPICAKVEHELIEFSPEEASEYMKTLGIEKSGLETLIQKSYSLLGLITYFTSGPKESRAWTIKKGTMAPQAAGVIHTDFEKGFIKAEVIFWKDFVDCRSEAKAKEKGLMRLEGKDYLVKDGDTMHFKFSS
ncbi:MAG: redox-regulated ATPase YchF [Candidatus Gracilibacteria bacterium]|jgi:GTP-binding protein YchF|nr:redox-regulated ATPase YchF [Candidatus Gracilibacteria bacterium]